MCKVYTVASGKGGTGKTTVTANLGVALAMRGKKTMVLDADVRMANLGFILNHFKEEVTLQEVLLGEAEPEQAIYDGPHGLKIVPGGLTLKGISCEADDLTEIVERLKSDVDFLLIDSPAGAGDDSAVPLALADEVLMVINADIASLSDAIRTRCLAEQVGTKVTGVIVNRFAGDDIDLSIETIQNSLEAPVVEIINDDSAVRGAISELSPVVLWAPSSQPANAFRRLASKICSQQIFEPWKPELSMVDRIKIALGKKN